MRVRTKLTLAIVVAAIVAIGGVSPAFAAPLPPPAPSITDASYAAADAFLAQNGADSATRARLMTTLESGGTWDS